MSSAKEKAFTEMHHPLHEALLASNALQMALAGFNDCDLPDEDLRGALQMIADEIKAGLSIAMSMWKEADSAAADA